MGKKKNQESVIVKKSKEVPDTEFITNNQVEADKITLANFKKYKVMRDTGKFQLYEICKIASDIDVSPNEVSIICDNYTYLSKKFSEKSLDKKKKNM